MSSPVSISRRKASPPAVDVTERLPLDPYPSGWYAVVFSEELAVREVKRVQWLGREVVAFRTASGVAAVFEAYCPHLGAHFGHGGCVIGETLRCPMHHFRFANDGACTATGPGYGRPPSARAGALPVREASGVLLAWHHPTSAAPTWEPPPLADPAWGAPHQRHVVLRTHVQDIAENLFDSGHQAAVHGYEDSVAHRPVIAEQVIHGHSQMVHVTSLFGRFTRRVNVDLRPTLHGLGIYLIDTVADPGGLAVRAVFTPTPVAPGHVAFRLSLWVSKPDAWLAALPVLRWLPPHLQNRWMARLLLPTMLRDVAQDQKLLDHKKYLARPALADADAAVSIFRRWARQFYSQTETQQ